MSRLSAPRVRTIRGKLLQWYTKQKRDLPWRQTTDPYAIWVSEIMLQQTRVDTVIPYYKRFLTEFPTVDTLARAKEERVLKKWEGLGYYSRARNLQTAAREIVGQYGGELPRKSEELQTLKGFGLYTAGAVASIAFGEVVPAIDGNVIRVYSRLFATNENIPKIANQLVDPNGPASFNQSVMELGALICLPRNPTCLICPLAKLCKARALGKVTEFPLRKKISKMKNINSIALVLQAGNFVLVRRRPSEGLWGGLWEFPMFEKMDQFHEQFRIKLARPIKMGTFRHLLSHRTIDVTVFLVQAEKKKVKKNEKWLPISSLRSLPFSRLAQRVEELAFSPPAKNKDLPPSRRRRVSPLRSVEIV